MHGGVVGHKCLNPKPTTALDEIGRFRTAISHEDGLLIETSLEDAYLHPNREPLRVCVSSLLVDSLEIQKVVEGLETSSARKVQLTAAASEEEETHALVEDQCDFVISSRNLALRGYSTTEIARLPLFALMTPQHGLSKHKTVSLSDLKERLVLPDGNRFPSLAEAYSHLFSAQGWELPSTIDRYRNRSALINLVSHGAIALSAHGDFSGVVSRKIDDAPRIPIYSTRSATMSTIL